MFTEQTQDILTNQPEVTAGVVAAYDYLRIVTHESIAINPRQDVALLVQDFAGSLVSSSLYDAANLLSIGDRLGDEITRSNAMRSLKKYIEAGEPQVVAYTIGVIGDFQVLNDYEEQKKVQWSDGSKESDIELKAALSNERVHNIPQRLWIIQPEIPPLKDLVRLAEDVNLESVLIKACAAYIRITDDSVPDQERLKLKFLIESSYAPVCEIIGLDAFAAMLLDATQQLSLKKSGDEKFVNQAKEAVEDLGTKTELSLVMKDIVNQAIGETELEQVIDDSYGHGIRFHMGFSDVHKGDIARIIMRLKSIGGIAKKIRRGGRLPADIVGHTIILKDTQATADVFATAISKLQSLTNVRLVSAPSRSEPIHIKGTRQFRDAVREKLGDPGILIEEVPNDNGFEVAKVTLMWQWKDKNEDTHDLPVEIQFMHEQARSESRIGRDAHVIFKYLKYSNNPDHELSIDEAVSALQQLHRRRHYLEHGESLTLNGASSRRGANLQRQIEQIDIPQASRKLGRSATMDATRT